MIHKIFRIIENTSLNEIEFEILTKMNDILKIKNTNIRRKYILDRNLFQFISKRLNRIYKQKNMDNDDSEC